MRSILNDVSIDEMMNMRESGMTNTDIAQALGCSYQTVHKYIGAQPSRGGLYARSIHPVSKNEEQEPEYEPVLPVVNSVTYLSGEACEYEVDSRSKRVNIKGKGGEGAIAIGFDSIELFADEIAAICRNLKEQIIVTEMW